MESADVVLVESLKSRNMNAEAAIAKTMIKISTIDVLDFICM